MFSLFRVKLRSYLTLRYSLSLLNLRNSLSHEALLKTKDEQTDLLTVHCSLDLF